MTRSRRPPPPLDAAALEALALRYVERFATTCGKLADYLARKVRERGWEGPPADPRAIAEAMAERGYIDDRAFAEARGAALGRRGYGVARVRQAMYQARVGAADAAGALEASEAEGLARALAFARRRRIGPYALDRADDRLRARQIAALVRAGHGFALARRIAEAEPGATIDADE